MYKFGFVEQISNYYCRGRRPRRPVRNVQNIGQMISAPTNPVSINHVGTGVLDRPLIQRNLRTVREAGPYELRDRLCEIKELHKPEFVGVLGFCRIQYLHLMRARVSGGHLCVAEAPTEAVAETVDFAKQKTEGEITRILLPLSLTSFDSSPDKWSYALFSFNKK